MKIGETFPSNYIKASELGKARPVVVIREVVVEDIGDETKPILYFEGKEKGLVLNRTNANAVTDILGSDETSEWIGKRVQLYVTKVDFKGQRVEAIRILEPPATAAPPAPPKPAPKPMTVAEQGPDDDVPF